MVFPFSLSPLSPFKFTSLLLVLNQKQNTTKKQPTIPNNNAIVLGRGGAGEIWKGQLTDSKLVKRYNMGPVAVKFIKRTFFPFLCLFLSSFSFSFPFPTSSSFHNSSTCWDLGG